MKFTALVALALSAISTLAAPAPVADVEERQLLCRDVYVYFARGTTEVGTLGTVVGPGLVTSVPIAVVGKSVEVEGIPYPALVSGYLAGGDRGGARTMANTVRETASRCPNAKIFISGYS
jgi:cutinase